MPLKSEALTIVETPYLKIKGSTNHIVLRTSAIPVNMSPCKDEMRRNTLLLTDGVLHTCDIHCGVVK
jgi:hypothetical protein